MQPPLARVLAAEAIGALAAAAVLRASLGNPLGPSIVSGDLHALWIYILAPVAGAALGGLAYQAVRGGAT